MAEEADDVVVGTDEFVEGEFDVELFGAEAAGAEGVLFVDEFNCDDWAWAVQGSGFADTRGDAVSGCLWCKGRGKGVRCIGSASYRFGDEFEGEVGRKRCGLRLTALLDMMGSSALLLYYVHPAARPL